MSEESVEIGILVSWLGNTYTVVSKNKKGVILKQNFSIRTVLNKEVHYRELEFVS